MSSTKNKQVTVPPARRSPDEPETARTLRILHVLPVAGTQALRGDTLSTTLTQCHALRREGHEARIAMGWRGSGRPPLLMERIPVHLFRVWPVVPLPAGHGMASLAMLTWLRRNAPIFDAAHIHLSRDLMTLLAARQLQRVDVPTVVQLHDDLPIDYSRVARLLDRTLTAPVLHTAGTRFVESQAAAVAITRLLGPPASAIYLPTDTPDDAAPLLAAYRHQHN